jgi:hypothetical protein
MCLLKYVLTCEQHFSYFDPYFPTFRITVTGLERDFCTARVMKSRKLQWVVNKMRKGETK